LKKRITDDLRSVPAWCLLKKRDRALGVGQWIIIWREKARGPTPDRRAGGTHELPDATLLAPRKWPLMSVNSTRTLVDGLAVSDVALGRRRVAAIKSRGSIQLVPFDWSSIVCRGRSHRWLASPLHSKTPTTRTPYCCSGPRCERATSFRSSACVSHSN